MPYTTPCMGANSQGGKLSTKNTVRMQSGSIYPIYVVSLFFFKYALFKMLTTLLKHTFQNGGQRQEAAKGASVYVLHLGKMT